MTDRIKYLRQRIIEKAHQEQLRTLDVDWAGQWKAEQVKPAERMVERLVRLLSEEKPVIQPEERIVFTRTIRNQPDLFTADEWTIISENHHIHELGTVSNVTPDYYTTIRVGFKERRREIQSALAGATEEEQDFLNGLLRVMDAVSALTDRYHQEARKQGNTIVADVLSRIPENGAETFHEALQFFRILHFTLWLEGEYHNTIGRFDQNMIPWLEKDLKEGRLSEADAFECLEEFFLTFNKDSNLYPGVQQGDNGQSMVLGGHDVSGHRVDNRLTRMCLEASRELKLIDPKINLRVGHDTPQELYQKGTRLTREGLGFPQYSNDDVVIPGLVDLGYAYEDAVNYSIAACWEFIIPGKAMDVVNIDAISFPAIIDRAVRDYLGSSGTFEVFLSYVEKLIAEACKKTVAQCSNLWFIPAPFLSVLTQGCIERKRDISEGATYNNWGLHGTGIATAVDSLTNIRRTIFEEQSLSAEDLIDAIDQDFKGHEELLHRLRYESPKFGDGSSGPEVLAAHILDVFARSVKDLRNERGGRIRAGTGTAMYYLWHVRDLPASPDGRRKGEPLSANYTPSLFARLPGPLTIINSFTKPDLKKTMNGGPLTLEFHDSLFRTSDSMNKVASLVKWYIDSGGHQLQLNAVNRDTLVDAKKHPENYSQLIVRVWGWSAYFCELDEAYQDHVIRRVEYSDVG
jgi:pyruvate-formate lyase